MGNHSSSSSTTSSSSTSSSTTTHSFSPSSSLLFCSREHTFEATGRRQHLVRLDPGGVGLQLHVEAAVNVGRREAEPSVHHVNVQHLSNRSPLSPWRCLRVV